MKRFLVCFLCLVLCFLAGCGRHEVIIDTLPSDSPLLTKPTGEPKPFAPPLTCTGPDHQAVELTEAQQETLLAILNRGIWHDDLPESCANFTLNAGGRTLQYVTHSGIFMDLSHWRTRYLSDEDKQTVNHILFPEITFRQYDWSGRGFSSKVIQGDSFVRSLVRDLEALTPSGEAAPKLSDAAFDETDADSPAPKGTLWIETGGCIYRLEPGFATISRVESHYGGGEVLTFPEGLRETIRDARQYHPNDCYTGTWQNGKLDLHHVYKAKAYAAIRVVDIDTSQAPNNHIPLEVTAGRTGNIRLWLESYRSEDDLGSGDFRELSMTEGETQTVELYYVSFAYPDTPETYWLSITSENTRLEIKVVR